MSSNLTDLLFNRLHMPFNVLDYCECLFVVYCENYDLLGQLSMKLIYVKKLLQVYGDRIG